MSADVVPDNSVSEPQYATAKTSVWWDIENCQVPRDFNPHRIAQNISSALVNLNYCGPISISAYGDTNGIPASVQHALSSTGVALNHVPAGVKDASDKKILVDMLFWAVDNPAPANYLLISGDRDFSNALHQLRMRRYNILLAQPLKASAALVAAAKTVWLWTSLISGKSPLTAHAGAENMSGNKTVNPEISKDPAAVLDNTTTTTTVTTTCVNPVPSLAMSKSLPLGNQTLFNPGWVGGTKSTVKYVQKNLNQTSSITRTSSEPLASNSSVRLENAEAANLFKKAPHEFFGARDPVISSSGIPPDPSGDNDNTTAIDATTTTTNSIEIQHNECNNQPQPAFASRNLPHLNSFNNTSYREMPSKPNVGHRFPSPTLLTNVPDIGRLSKNDPTNYSRNHPPNFKQGRVQEFKSKLGDSSNFFVPQRQNIAPSTRPPENRWDCHPYSSPSTNIFSIKGGIQGTQQPSYEYIQGLIGIILLALNTLKQEKIMPTEANICDCIHYGDPKYRNTDVKQALDFAVEQQMVLVHTLGEVPLYIGRMERLWKCVNPIDVNDHQYPECTWDAIQKFLTSSDGCSAIMASECRYEAALILKNGCLKHLTLGEVLQILNMVITVKKWISQRQLGWQPITICVAENNEKETGG